MTPTISIKTLHLEYRLWINELSFAKEEINIYERHLEELIAANTDTDILAEAEKFQNQFICQKEVIDVLKHDLHVSERQLANVAKNLSGFGLEIMRMDNHEQLRERMKTFRKLIQELKDEFKVFESKIF